MFINKKLIYALMGFIIVLLFCCYAYNFLSNSLAFKEIFVTYESSPTLSSFMGDFIATLYTLILGTFLIPAYLEWRKRPKLAFINRYSRLSECILTKGQGGHWEGTFELAVQSATPTTILDWNWTILVPINLVDVKVVNAATGIELTKEQLVKNKWDQIHDRVSWEPLYPNSSTRFPYRIIVNSNADTSKPIKLELYYYFSTEFGVSPTSANKFREMVRAMGKKAEDKFQTKYFGKLTLVSEA